MNKESIVLIGMAGAGKSTIGVALAKELDFNFTDLDEYIREKDHQTIQGIIDTQGEDSLLQIERLRIREIDLKRRVVSPGGSLIYHAELMEYLKQHSIVVYLDESFENIEARIKNASTRGIVGLKAKTLRQIFDERKPLYDRYADITINPRGKSQAQVVQEILNHYRKLNQP